MRFSTDGRVQQIWHIPLGDIGNDKEDPDFSNLRPGEAVGVHSVVAEVNAGASLACALTGTSEPGGLLRAALLAVEMSGGAGAAAVERLADRMRLGAGAEATARAQSGQQLASASLMAALPPVIALLYALSDRRAAEFYTKSLAGALLVVSAMALSGLSWLWMRWILQSRSLR